MAGRFCWSARRVAFTPWTGSARTSADCSRKGPWKGTGLPALSTEPCSPLPPAPSSPTRLAWSRPRVG